MLLVTLLVAMTSVSLGKELEAQRNFQLRECRQRTSWRGDVGDLHSNTFKQEHPRDVKVHSRQRRFLAFPTGSSLSVYSGLYAPLQTYNNGFNSLALYLGFPFTILLPNAPLVFSGKGSSSSTTTTTTTTSAPSYGSYGSSGSTYNRQDIPLEYYNHYNYYNYVKDSADGYSSYSSYDPHGPYSKRSLDSQRQTGFKVIENGLENMGLPGKLCLLRAVCEVAEEPVSDLGLIGDALNMFLAAGFGEGSDEMSDFVAAEELGRKEGDCEDKYSECPLPLADLLQGGLSYLHAGLANAGTQSAKFL